MSAAPSHLLKTHLSYTAQLALLKQRGLIVADDDAAAAFLQRLNYYRLSGYWYPFRKTNPHGVPGRQDEFRAGTTFEHLIGLYEFDRQLRLLVLSAIERIEVAVRVDIAHRLGIQHPCAHEEPSLLDGNFTGKIVNLASGQTAYELWKAKLADTVRKAKDDFVKHHRTKYKNKMPIWVIVELWEFGQLSKFFAGMKSSDQTYIARRYGLTQGNYLESWLRALNFVRNVSAHHGRLWNRNITDRPSFPAGQPHHRLYHIAADTHAQTRVYGVLCVIQQMLRTISPDDRWNDKLKSLCQQFPITPVVSLNNAGFVAGWDHMPLWQ